MITSIRFRGSSTAQQAAYMDEWSVLTVPDMAVISSFAGPTG